MKFICTKENLSHALSLVCGIAGKNISLPILGNVLIKATEQKVEMITTNLEVAIISQLRAKVEVAGSFTVPARTLNDFVNLLADEKVELSLVGSELEVVCGKSATKIKGAPADEFPLLPAAQDGRGFTVDCEVLKKGLEQVSQSAAKNEIRPELAGVLFDFNNENGGFLTMAATDSYRLAEKKIKLAQGEEKVKAIVPCRTAQEISRILAVSKTFESERSARLMINDSQIVMRFNDVEIISRLIEGQYPDYTQIIPKEFKTTAEFSTSVLIKEIKAAGLFTTTGVNAITFDLKPQESLVGISSASTQTGDHKSQISAEISGENNSILLNHRYVLDGLGNIETETGSLKVINGDSPCVLSPKGDDSFVYIVMPIRQ